MKIVAGTDDDFLRALARPTPNERDFCRDCAGLLVRERNGGRRCWDCGAIEPTVKVRVRTPEGVDGWAAAADVVTLVGRDV